MATIPCVSIIIPVYNTEQYLQECLDSLISQTLTNIEIICIDDGSTDGSKELLKDYQQKDTRIKVIQQENKGQSVARNAGLEIAQGEYVGFLDSDDFARPEMFEKLYNQAKLYNSDICMCSIARKNEQTNTIIENDTYMTLDLFPEKFENRNFQPQETFDFLFRICVTPWNKIYRNSFLKENKIKFEENINFEDNLFFMETYLSAKNISLIKENLVVYRIFSETSYTTNTDKDYKKLDFFKIMKKKEQILRKHNLYTQLENYFKEYKKGTLIYWYKKIRNTKTKIKYRWRLLLEYPAMLKIK